MELRYGSVRVVTRRAIDESYQWLVLGGGSRDGDSPFRPLERWYQAIGPTKAVIDRQQPNCDKASQVEIERDLNSKILNSCDTLTIHENVITSREQRWFEIRPLLAIDLRKDHSTSEWHAN